MISQRMSLKDSMYRKSCIDIYPQVYIHLITSSIFFFFFRESRAPSSQFLWSLDGVGWGGVGGRPLSPLATSNALKLLNRQEGLYWLWSELSDFHGQFYTGRWLGASIHPEPFGREEMRFLLHLRIYCSVKTRYTLPLSHMTWYCLARDTARAHTLTRAHTHTHTHTHTHLTL